MKGYLKGLKAKVFKKKKKSASKESDMSPKEFTSYRLKRMKEGSLSTTPEKGKK